MMTITKNLERICYEIYQKYAFTDECVTYNEDIQQVTTPTNPTITLNQHTQPTTVVDAALALPPSARKPISAAQERCLSMQEKQHQAEMNCLA